MRPVPKLAAEEKLGGRNRIFARDTLRCFEGTFFSFLTSEASRTSSTQTSPPVAKRSLNASHVHTCSSVVFVGRREASKVGSLDATLQV